MANTFITRTPSSAGNKKTFTLSVWVKRITLGSDYILTARNGTGSLDSFFFGFRNNQIQIDSTASGGDKALTFRSNALYRDTFGWYNIILAVDTTQSTASDRAKLYVNGSQITSFEISTYPDQNDDFYGINDTIVHSFGREYFASGTAYHEYLLSHINFIDGTAYDASAFGQYDANGVWTIKTSPSVTYGTNGFFILKDGNSVTDQSGNGNNFTVAGGTLTNTEDNPSNVFATVNSLFNPDPSNPLSSISNGNLSFTTNSTSDTSMGVTTFGASSGKWYAEIKSTGESGTGEAFAGIGYDIYENATTSMNSDSSFMWNVCSNGDAKFGGSGQGIGNWSNTYTTNDIISIALDLDNNRVYFAKNGQYADGSGNWNQAFTGSPAYATITADKTYFFCAGDKSGSQTASWSCNFGNGYFGTTAVASAGTNASGNGIFEYDVPTGYTAFCTKGLNGE